MTPEDEQRRAYIETRARLHGHSPDAECAYCQDRDREQAGASYRNEGD